MVWTGEALRAMGGNPLRTALAMLGMIIGVGAVVMMLAVGQGAQTAVERSIRSMGSNLFIVLAGATTSGGLRFGTGTSPRLTVQDAEAIAALPSVKAVAPILSGTMQLVYGNANWSTVVYGITPDYLAVRNWEIESGNGLDEADVRGAARVAVLGATVVQSLFGDEDPVGRTIRVGASPFRVLGTLAAKGQSLDGRDQDDTVLVPLSTGQRTLFGNQFPGSVRYIMAQATTPEAMDDAEAEMVQLLRQRHRLREGQENDFTVRNLTASAQAAAASSRVMSLLLGAIASVSLLVGGIGIMNIMLVSVTERTREIGIRMAIGARRADILLQFLLEALVICAVGGVAGVALGIGCGWLASEYAEMVVEVTGSAVALAFAFSAGVGVFFGFYPALRAARLNPVEALRRE